MPTLSASNIPTPKSWDEFEDIAVAAAKLRWGTPNSFRNGRTGQAQNGVDGWGTTPSGRRIGLQGKNTVGGVTQATVLSEITAAESFQPSLDELYVVTTAPRDARIQHAVRMISDTRTAAGQFTVAILFWDDIASDLMLDDDVFFRHYPQLRSLDDAAREHDDALAEKLLALLPSNGVIRFVDENNMAGFLFRLDRFEPLRTFVYDWNNAEHEFLHPELELAKRSLWQKVDAYVGLLNAKTYPSRSNSEWFSVPGEWELDHPQMFRQVVEEFHSLAGEIVALHAEFIRTSKRVLIGGQRSPSS
ncbi:MULTISPECIES: hypothetical protein [unclassified Aureimonas]|uniref:hypothetical protein n=1 Tax=unclassified Aureimonas TaxID=2615206 RepID=UPI0006FCC2DD|nr:MULTISPECIES: hypothetical protein [unclassified Aureimonas]KQT60571.1 hypothetical protein ASG62_08015 [Aureimonas sp. Leaf427]KQT79446.1 hypothetical protein ASG54_10610 [Aureimonas sp. Leaf460]